MGKNCLQSSDKKNMRSRPTESITPTMQQNLYVYTLINKWSTQGNQTCEEIWLFILYE